MRQRLGCRMGSPHTPHNLDTSGHQNKQCPPPHRTASTCNTPAMPCGKCRPPLCTCNGAPGPCHRGCRLRLNSTTQRRYTAEIRRKAMPRSRTHGPLSHLWTATAEGDRWCVQPSPALTHALQNTPQKERALGAT